MPMHIISSFTLYPESQMDRQLFTEECKFAKKIDYSRKCYIKLDLTSDVVYFATNETPEYF